jgi:phenylacetate-CoA ligase
VFSVQFGFRQIFFWTVTDQPPPSVNPRRQPGSRPADDRSVTSDDQARLSRVNAVLARVATSNRFQRPRLESLRTPNGEMTLRSLEDLAKVPLVNKQDLLEDQARHPPFGSNLTFALADYTRLHQTSGTTSSTLRVLDTSEDWRWWRRCLGNVFSAAGIGPGDRVALAFSFGPYIQFWASYEGVQEVGAITIPLGGMDSIQRLQTMLQYGATALLCTPSYALHLARVAGEQDLSDALAPVTRLVCTGEPGASVPSVRERIESAWGARCFDHGGATEAGCFAYPCAVDGGLHLAEDDFVCEIIDPATAARLDDANAGELVVTSLYRTGFPVIRYRTGDVVRISPEPCSAGHPGRWLPDGIIGRVDDMVVIRGMNVFPSSIEETLREFPGAGEFRITFYNDPRAMDEIKVEVELGDSSQAREMQSRMRQHLGLRVRIVPLKPGILPEQTGKARRVEDLRPAARRADQRSPMVDHEPIR